MDDLSFFGCPQKQVVKIRPTKDCLVAISEFPFFVMDVNEIEAVVFERVLFGIKNFDLAIIFKDFTTMKRINSVPMEHIEELKSYFDEIDVIYAESEAPFNWGTLLSHIRDNFEDWLEEGAWGFLLDGVSEFDWLILEFRLRKKEKVVKKEKMSLKTSIQAAAMTTKRVLKKKAISQISATKRVQKLIAKNSVKRVSAGKNLISKPKKRIANWQPSVAQFSDNHPRPRTLAGDDS